MSLNFTYSDEAAKSRGVKILVYGSAGIGKTTLCATAPAPVIISNESGMLSLAKRNLERMFGVDSAGITYNIPVIEITNIQGLEQAYEWCRSSAEAKNFRTICLDSLSEMAEVVLNNAKKTSKDPRQAYGELIERMEDFIRKFRDLPDKNVYFSAKMEAFKDEFSGMVRYGPSMPGAKLGQKLPYFFDEMFRLGIGQDPVDTTKKFRFLQTQPDMQYEAKDRSGALEGMEYPHLGHIFHKITGE